MKYIITGLHCSGKQEIAKLLKEYGFKLGRNFSSLKRANPRIYGTSDYEYYGIKEIEKIFENNAYLFLQELYSDATAQNYFVGLTKAEFDSADVFIMSPDELLNISHTDYDMINSEDVVIVWIDNTKETRIKRYNDEKREYAFNEREALEREDIRNYADKINDANKSTILYFLNDEPLRVVYTIIGFNNGDDWTKNLIKEACS